MLGYVGLGKEQSLEENIIRKAIDDAILLDILSAVAEIVVEDHIGVFE